MRRILVISCLAAFIAAASVMAGCGDPIIDPAQSLRPRDFLFHKNTLYIKVHWKITSPDKDTVKAEGFVEPFDHKTAVYGVRLELVGLDKDGQVVSSAEGRPRDNYIASPLENSPFSITMKLTGKEHEFTIRGDYYHHDFGSNRGFGSEFYDNIPLVGNEPY